MSWHKDKEVNSALLRLMDALCEWERNTGRETSLMLIPHNPDENVVLVENGKPLTGLLDDEHPLRFLVDAALGERFNRACKSFASNSSNNIEAEKK